MAANLIDLVIQASMQAAVGSSVSVGRSEQATTSRPSDGGLTAELVKKLEGEITEEIVPAISDAEWTRDISTSLTSTESRHETESSSGEESDGGELSKEQRRALDSLRVQTARDNHEYLKQHPEVRAMLTLLVRETVRQDRPALTVAGELFRSERHLVDAVRRMLHITPTSPRRRRLSEEEDSSLALASPSSAPSGARRTHATSPTGVDRPRSPARVQDFPSAEMLEEIQKMARASTDVAFDRCFDCSLRRATPVPWPVEEALDAVIKDGEALQRRDSPAPWALQEEAAELVSEAAEKAQFHVELCRMIATAAERASCSESGAGDGEDEEVPVSRRDTPAPWSVSAIVDGSGRVTLRKGTSPSAVAEEGEESLEVNGE